jgi:hypothetical protein
VVAVTGQPNRSVIIMEKLTALIKAKNNGDKNINGAIQLKENKV